MKDRTEEIILTEPTPYTSPTHSDILGINLNERTFKYFLWGLQLTFWSLWFLLAINSEPAQRFPKGPYTFAFAHLPVLMAAVYFNYFVLVPYFLARRKYFLYILSIIGLLLCSQGLRYSVDLFILGYDETFFMRVPLGTTLAFFLITISTLFKFVEGWFHVSQEQVQLQNEQLKSELRFLRAQVNPHFLFNILNNLYSLTLVRDERAPKVIAQLSEMMRYLIYDSSTTRVTLLREIELMSSYIELQQLQFDEEKNVDLYFEGVKNTHQIAPLLLISFLENSFKHGNLSTDSDGWISVSAIVEDDHKLSLSFRNSYRPGSRPSEKGEGIGLKNAKRQLELNYPDKHQLSIQTSADEFRVDLFIELDTYLVSEELPEMKEVNINP